MQATERIAAFRFGFGLPLPGGAGATPDGLRSAIGAEDAAARRWPGLRLAEALPMHQALIAARVETARSKGEDRLQNFNAHLRAAEAAQIQAQRVQAARAIGAADGFRERLVRFWQDHFTVVARARVDRLITLTLVEDAIRPHVFGRFAEMLTAATLHPAMLRYLDQTASVGPGSPYGQRRKAGLNENLARELIELHSLGVGGAYGQADVRQLAELLTGLVFEVGEGTVFRENRAEPGAETVLGTAYEGPGIAPIRQVLEDLSIHPDTAHHIARKLAVHFVADTPDPALVQHLEATWRATGGDLAAVSAALLDHPAAWVPEMAKARQPYDFVIAALRALGLDGDRIMAMDDRRFRRDVMAGVQMLGQPASGPKGPDGWPEEIGAWITPQHMAARIRWSVTMPARIVDDLPDPRSFAETALGDLAEGPAGWAAARSESVAQGVGLVLASPAFNRR